jgi:hypothetical protein
MPKKSARMLPDCLRHLAEHEVKAPPELRTRQRPKDPGGRCFELAAEYFLDHHKTDGVTLVHGITAAHNTHPLWKRWTFGRRMKHAWVALPGDLVYDRGRFFSGKGFRLVMQPEVVASWSGAGAREFCAWHVTANAYGPCPELAAAGDAAGAM